MQSPSTPDPSFDSFAGSYEEALNQGLKFTGEDRWYYANGRCRRTAEFVGLRGGSVRRILDFGCGTGTATQPLLDTFTGAHLVGTDPSSESLTVATRDHAGLSCEFVLPQELSAQAPFDLAYCNGVFHHIPVADRASAVSAVYDALQPGGWFALWENNPWNPAVWFVMSRVPFDHDAILLWPAETRRLLRKAGFEIAETRFWFVFPGLLASLRPTEKALSRLPLGGQYVVLARKPVK